MLKSVTVTLAHTTTHIAGLCNGLYYHNHKFSFHTTNQETYRIWGSNFGEHGTRSRIHMAMLFEFWVMSPSPIGQRGILQLWTKTHDIGDVLLILLSRRQVRQWTGMWQHNLIFELPYETSSNMLHAFESNGRHCAWDNNNKQTPWWVCLAVMLSRAVSGIENSVVMWVNHWTIQ